MSLQIPMNYNKLQIRQFGIVKVLIGMYLKNDSTDSVEIFRGYISLRAILRIKFLTQNTEPFN